MMMPASSRKPADNPKKMTIMPCRERGAEWVQNGAERRAQGACRPGRHRHDRRARGVERLAQVVLALSRAPVS